MDAVDKRIVNRLQRGFPVCARPFAAAARDLGIDEADLLHRIESLLADGVLTRFGPLFDAGRLGGLVTLCAAHVPAGDLERCVAAINEHPEVAHNYERDHHLNIWFVIAAESAARVDQVIDRIESSTGLNVLNFPKETEFYVGLHLEV